MRHDHDNADTYCVEGCPAWTATRPQAHLEVIEDLRAKLAEAEARADFFEAMYRGSIPCGAARTIGPLTITCTKGTGHHSEHCHEDEKHRRTFWADGAA